MINILNRCSQIYQNQRCCHHDGRFCDCMNCIQDGFYNNDNDAYNCLKRLCIYTINYGPAYVSEIYHFLSASQVISRFKSICDEVNVLSIGCGFAPDFIALTKYIYNERINLKIMYTGYDIENNWQNITSGIINNVPIIHNALDGFSLDGFQIIFLNKLFSTLKQNNQSDNFLNILARECRDSMSNGALLVFNDINHWAKGRDEFDSKISRMLNPIGKYYFNVREAYNNNYTEIPQTHNICQIPSGLPVNPLQVVTKSVFFLYQKQD